MSHNQIKVGDQPPDVSGNITLNLDDISDVATSGAALNDILEYDGSAWSATAPSVSTGISLYAGCSQKSTYNSSTYYYSIGDYRESIISSSYMNRYNPGVFNAATPGNTPIGNSNWSESFDVTAGTYWVQISVTAHCPYGQSSTWQLEGNSGAFSARATVDSRNYGAQSNCILSGIYTATGPDIIRAVLVSHTQFTKLEHAAQTYFTGQTIVKIG